MKRFAATVSILMLCQSAAFAVVEPPLPAPINGTPAKTTGDTTPPATSPPAGSKKTSSNPQPAGNKTLGRQFAGETGSSKATESKGSSETETQALPAPRQQAIPKEEAPRGTAEHKPVAAPTNAAEAAPESISEPSLPAGTPVHQPSTPAGVSTVRPESKNILPPGVHPQLALTLAGGGARGAAHIGVLKVLEENGIHPQFISGASAGAVIGALYSAGVPASRLEQLALNGEFRKAFLPRPLLLQTAISMPTYAIKRMLFLKPEFAIYDGKSIEQFMNRNLPATCHDIRRFPVHFSAISTNLLDTRTVWAAEGDAAQAARASASVPFVYKPVMVKGKALVDGGVRANLPTDPAAAAGAPVVVAVRLYADLSASTFKNYKKIYAYADRVLGMLLAEIEAKATANADVVIEPTLGNMAIYDFDTPSLAKAIEAGEVAARKLLPQIRQRLRNTNGTAAMDGHVPSEHNSAATEQSSEGNQTQKRAASNNSPQTPSTQASSGALQHQ